MESLQGFKSFVLSPGFIPQILLVLIILTILATIYSVIDVTATAVKRFDRQTAVVLENTHTKSVVIPQDANSADDENYPLLYPSVNERHGLEYSFSFHAFIDPESFQPVISDTCGNSEGQESVGLRHIFHKGNRNFFPLMSPGAFLHADKNTIRIIMNSESNWANYVDIPNIPVGKWFHMVISVKGQFMDVYLNGNIATRKEFNSVPKINFGSVYVLQDRKFPESGAPSQAMHEMKFVGAMKGMISRLHYYAFALNYSQIDSLYRQAPSKKIESPSFTQMPPYFRDEWWVTKY